MELVSQVRLTPENMVLMPLYKIDFYLISALHFFLLDHWKPTWLKPEGYLGGNPVKPSHFMDEEENETLGKYLIQGD